MLVPQVLAAVGPPPEIILQPADQAVLYGEPMTMSVVVSSTTKCTFKWYKDGNKIPSANSNSYTIVGVSLADAGTYFVEVRNSADTVTSSNAILTIIVPPVTCVPTNMTTNGFSFRMDGPVGADFVVLASTNLADWTPIATNAAPTGTVDFTDPTAIRRPLGYYRANAVLH
jgi:hypothetical protein